MARTKRASGTSSFPTMGTTVASNIQTAPVVRGRSVRRTGEIKGGFLESATAAHRPGIQERLGAQLHPTATLYAANAAAAGQTLRNTRLVPSAVGNRDFWLQASVRAEHAVR